MLYKHQRDLLKKNPNKILLCWDTGTGKTIGSILLSNKKKGDTLIICPKSIKKNWISDCDKFIKGNYTVITKERFRRDWKKLIQSTTIIVDEAHFFANKKSQMTKSLIHYTKIHNVENIFLLTATPYTSSPWSVFTLASILGHNWSWVNFRTKFFENRYIGTRVVPQVKEGIEEEIRTLVRSIGHVVDISECVDIPEQVHEIEYFECDDIKDVAESNPIVRFTKYHQIENGVLKGNEYEDNQKFKVDKDDRILKYCEEVKKVAIICRYNLQIDKLKDLLESVGHTVYVIRGDVKNRSEVVDEIEKSKNCKVLIQADCAEGYELSSIGLILFASMSFSYVKYKQVIGRFLRINKIKKNVFIYLISKRKKFSIDKAIYDSVMKKQDFSISIYRED